MLRSADVRLCCTNGVTRIEAHHPTEVRPAVDLPFGFLSDCDQTEVNCCKQALAQACAVCSPRMRSMSVMAMLRQLGAALGVAAFSVAKAFVTSSVPVCFASFLSSIRGGNILQRRWIMRGRLSSILGERTPSEFAGQIAMSGDYTGTQAVENSP